MCNITCVRLQFLISTICSYTAVRDYVWGMSQASLDKMVVRHAKYGLFTPQNDREKAFVKAAQRRLAAGTGRLISILRRGQNYSCRAANTSAQQFKHQTLSVIFYAAAGFSHDFFCFVG